ncbi:endonuclease/exonuclease/phosphatase family protein, partial [Kitasatospora kazusensis]|uniref:endonuclease/exonuclease/phosphatase family protein n=1 Tax=Kitasatospora kazusensis TaxID=407974 RepID=UPI0031D89AFA
AGRHPFPLAARADLFRPHAQEAPLSGSDHELRIVSYNIEKGKHLDDACRWLAEYGPDVVLWQEMQPGDLHQVGAQLGMHGYAAAVAGGSRNDNVVFVHDDGLLMVDAEYLHPWAPWHAPANVTVRLRRPGGAVSPRALALVSEHSCYYSATIRQREADWYSSHAQPGRLVIVGGDWNSFPDGEGPSAEEWAAVADRAYFANRTYETAPGVRVSDERPDRTLTTVGLVDTARYARDKLGQSEATAPTAGYRRPDQGALRRIDRIYASGELAPAIVRASTIDTPELRTVSDHLPVELVLDLEALEQVLTGA